MLVYEPFQQQQQPQYFPLQYDAETSPIEPYHSTDTSAFEPTTLGPYQHSVSMDYSNTGAAAIAYGDMSLNVKFDSTVRSTSRNSNKRSIHDMPPASFSSGSVASASSSSAGSPYFGNASAMAFHENYHLPTQVFLPAPTIASDDGYLTDFTSAHLRADPVYEIPLKVSNTFAEPILAPSNQETFYGNMNQYMSATGYLPHATAASSMSPAPSPVPSQHSYHPFSQPVTLDNFNYAMPTRRLSISSQRSGQSPRFSASGDEESAKGRCPHPDCGKPIRDLKAHMLTHQSERPEKCPIPTCEYHTKGFARKYDKNRHTLTHYKGTMVCGFCPGSGSPAEKSFNRADVFKRHLTSVHNVEQNPPNSRKRSPGGSHAKLSSYCSDATGKCSTCSATFSNAQVFYDHLDDCVLRVVQQEDPCEAINAAHLMEIDADPGLQATLDRHLIKREESENVVEEHEDDEDDEDDDEEDEDQFTIHAYDTDLKPGSTTNRAVIGGNVSKKTGRRGLTRSKGGKALVGKGRKRRRNYPPSWGLAAEKMNMKKRVLCVYDGQHRLLKDDMMLSNEFEVRVKLPDGVNHVTDLDVETLKRANAFHNATEEEKGPWSEDEQDPWSEQDLLNLMR